MELNEKQFTAGFNSGYILAQYEPKLLINLLKNIHPVTSYIYGMTSGLKEYEIDLTKNRINEINNIRVKNKFDRERDL